MPKKTNTKKSAKKVTMPGLEATYNVVLSKARHDANPKATLHVQVRHTAADGPTNRNYGSAYDLAAPIDCDLLLAAQDTVSLAGTSRPYIAARAIFGGRGASRTITLAPRSNLKARVTIALSPPAYAY